MEEVHVDHLNHAVKKVLSNVVGIDELYAIQTQLLSSLVKKQNIFFTSGKFSIKNPLIEGIFHKAPPPP